MKIILWILFISLSVIRAEAQPVYTQQDLLLYKEYVTQFKKKSGLPLNDLIIETALFFKGTPYVASTLDNNDKEQLVINLRQFDCTTFVETCMALSKTIKTDDFSFSNFCRQLQTIRYRQSEIDGYSSRLHYVTDWIYDNQKKNILSDRTKSIGGITDYKVINFMSTHTDAYAQLKNNTEQQLRIKDIETAINKRKNYNYIQKADIYNVKNEIKDGDIIVFATSIKGLDYSHIGIAYHTQGKLSFIHASTKSMKVITEPLSLYDYCMKSSKCVGITVLRPK